MEIKFSCSLLFLIITMIVEATNIPKQSTLTSKNFDLGYYTIIKKDTGPSSFKFLMHNTNTFHFNKLDSIANTAEYLSLEIFIISRNTIQLIFRDANETRFELPREEPFPYHKYPDHLVTDFNINNLNYDYEIIIKEKPFSFTLMRKATKEIIFTTLNKQIIFKHNYAEISTDIPSDNLFGLGERTTEFKIKSGIYTFYNKDLYGELEDGKGKGKNRYGSHPMYLMRERSGNYHISYLRNSFPMDIIVKHETSEIKYKIAGGVLDFTFFVGDNNPETAIKMYHKYLGGYSLPPFWAMGFHQSRWGYKNLFFIHEVLQKYEDYKLPLDVIWSDIDYMESYMPFALDTQLFNPKLFKNTLKKYKKKYVMIIEPSIGTKWPDYKYLEKGKDLNIFIKNNEGKNLINKVWAGKCHFIDFFNPKSKEYWEDGMSDLYKKIEYSGVWLDMNEIATFEMGQMDMSDEVLSCNDDTVYPYIPGKKFLETATICPNAVHYKNMKHVEVHNYYPNMQSKRTYDFLEKLFPDQFPFILTRANAPGIGKYAAHWSGDNYGRFSFYKLSIAEVFNFNLFGAPIVGADICGFGEDTPQTLCAKWYQLGSLYPFSRSHAHIDSYRKEPFAMGTLLLETTLKSLQFRYSILKYYYSLFMQNQGTGTVFKPLFFEFYDDPGCLENSYINNYFMIGSALLAVPNLHDDNLSTVTPAYFPKGQWFDLRNRSRVNKRNNEPHLVTIETPLREMPAVFLRSGKTIFTNDIKNVRNTYDLNNEFNLLIAMEDSEDNLEKYTSSGTIPALKNYHSKSKVQNCIKKSCFVQIVSTFQNKTLEIKFFKADFYDAVFDFITIKSFEIYGIETKSISKIKSTNLDLLTQKSNKNSGYQLDIINDYCFSVKVNKLWVKNNDEMEIIIIFN